MKDNNNNEPTYGLLRPLEPDLRRSDIKAGNAEYYIALRSKERFDDSSSVDLWQFDLKFRQYMLPIPNIPWLNRHTVAVNQPAEKDLYFDDSLFGKITPDERAAMMGNL